jgi:ppGpp synthetase/RelA/SpoT-type nucleotidyltranferase
MMLDMHSEMILNEYREKLPIYEKMKTVVLHLLRTCLDENHVIVSGLEARVKSEPSLVGKLELKGYKYHTLEDVTDVVGARIITFYSDEVDIISALAEKLFEIDWDNSVDKRKMLEIDRFGYLSLHYVCRIPETLYKDPEIPQLNQIRFELQMRSTLQHVWANMYHDIGYKSDLEIPVEYQRNMTRLAGMLELADEQFSRIRKEINGYRRTVQSVVANGNLDEVPLNGDTFRSFLKMRPFKRLADKIAAINQGEVYEDNLMPYYNVLLHMNMKTIGDIVKMCNEYSESAYQLALLQLAGTGLDIVTYSVAVQNLCIVLILKKGYGEAGLVRLFEALYGENDYHQQRAKRIYEQARKINLV